MIRRRKIAGEVSHLQVRLRGLLAVAQAAEDAQREPAPTPDLGALLTVVVDQAERAVIEATTLQDHVEGISATTRYLGTLERLEADPIVRKRIAKITKKRG